jgi:hypothetical protein
MDALDKEVENIILVSLEGENIEFKKEFKNLSKLI